MSIGLRLLVAISVCTLCACTQPACPRYDDASSTAWAHFEPCDKYRYPFEPLPPNLAHAGCYPLCRPDQPACPTGRTCEQRMVLGDPNFDCTGFYICLPAGR